MNLLSAYITYHKLVVLFIYNQRRLKMTISKKIKLNNFIIVNVTEQIIFWLKFYKLIVNGIWMFLFIYNRICIYFIYHMPLLNLLPLFVYLFVLKIMFDLFLTEPIFFKFYDIINNFHKFIEKKIIWIFKIY